MFYAISTQILTAQRITMEITHSSEGLSILALSVAGVVHKMTEAAPPNAHLQAQSILQLVVPLSKSIAPL